MSELTEIRWHGRGGQGAVTASEILAEAALEEGKYFQAFPDYGPERMGAPIRAYTRISTSPIRQHCQITDPDAVVVLDPTLIGVVDFTEGIKDGGVVVVNTGNGKGKSSASFGMLARALGHGMQAAVVQFIKGSGSTGEENFFRQSGVEYHVMGDGFTWETQNLEQDIKTAEKAWAKAAEMLSNPDIQLVVLDELNIVLKQRYLGVELVLEALANRPAMQHVVITGRGAPPELIDNADTVTEMKPIKHAFAAGIKAQPGVEF